MGDKFMSKSRRLFCEKG